MCVRWRERDREVDLECMLSRGVIYHRGRERSMRVIPSIFLRFITNFALKQLDTGAWSTVTLPHSPCRLLWHMSDLARLKRLKKRQYGRAFSRTMCAIDAVTGCHQTTPWLYLMAMSAQPGIDLDGLMDVHAQLQASSHRFICVAPPPAAQSMKVQTLLRRGQKAIPTAAEAAVLRTVTQFVLEVPLEPLVLPAVMHKHAADAPAVAPAKKAKKSL